MFRIPWFCCISSFGFAVLVAFWSYLLSFSLFRNTTSILTWLRLPWQAADGRPVHPVRPPPLPDPVFQHSILLLGSLGFLRFMPSVVSPVWHCLGLLSCLVLVWLLFRLSMHLFPMVLDRLSNTSGRPSWFVRPSRCPHSRSPLPFHACYHWDPDWSINDLSFWFVILLLHVGCSLGRLIFFSWLRFLLHAGNAWIWWCSDSLFDCGCSWVNPCGSLLYWSFGSFHQCCFFMRRC